MFLIDYVAHIIVKTKYNFKEIKTDTQSVCFLIF